MPERVAPSLRGPAADLESAAVEARREAVPARPLVWVDRASAAAPAFDALADTYDGQFTRRRLGRWLRRAVRARFAEAFRPGERVLELGCGTGEDARWLAHRGVRVVACDSSPAMLRVARRKLEAAGVTERVELIEADAAAFAAAVAGGASLYDGAYSVFGVLNCVRDRRTVADTLAARLRPGGRVVLVVMGPFCPWEVAWYLAHGRPAAAVRRLRGGWPARVGERGVPVWYPTPRRLRAEFGDAFRVLATSGIGALLPTSDAAGLVDRWPRPFRWLARVERRAGRIFPLTWLNDHYLMMLERR